MATAPANDPGFVAPGDIIPLDPNEIDLGERLRSIDMTWAEAIGQSMRRDGQIHLVDVRPDGSGGWKLAGAGGHRVTGARLAGIPIESRVVLFSQGTDRRREAAENLFRRANDPLERAQAIVELVRLHREHAGIEETAHRSQSATKALRDEAEGTCDTMSHVYGWAGEVAAELGFSKRTIQRDLFLYRALRPSVVEALRQNRHQVLKNAGQLTKLARLDGAEQSAVANRLIAGARSVAEALALIAEKSKPSAEDRRLSTFIGTFARMTLSEKRGALSQLAGMLPAPFKLVEVK